MKNRVYQVRVSDEWLNRMDQLKRTINASVIGEQSRRRGLPGLTNADLIMLALDTTFGLPFGTAAAMKTGAGFDHARAAVRRINGELYFCRRRKRRANVRAIPKAA